MAETRTSSEGVEIDTSKIKIAIKGTIGILGAAVVYLFGVASYSLSNVYYPTEYVKLIDKKTELVRNIDEWKRYNPLMKEPFATQYKNSLENAIKDTSKINSRVNELEKEQQKKHNKEWYSWLAFFMKD